MFFVNSLIMIILMVIEFLAVGATIKFGWNTFLVSALGFPAITIPIAIGINILFTYIVGYSQPNVYQDMVAEAVESDERWGKLVGSIVSFTYSMISTGVALVAMYIISLFL